MKSIRIQCCVVALLGALVAPAVPAADNATYPLMAAPYYGRGADTDMFGTQIVWRPRCACEFLARYSIEPRLAVDVAYWSGRQPNNAHPSLWELGAHGFLRHDWHPGEITFSPFVEGGFGVHVLSESKINNQRDFGTQFQFGSRIGAGVAFDRPHRFELIAYVEHVSNARLASPNDGITFKGIELRVALP